MSAQPERRARDEAEARTAEGEQHYLRLLGERVRNARARRGLTRKALSTESGVSERYLAQLETGQGNISILLLKQIAAVLREPLRQLVAEDTPLSPSHRLAMQQVENLDEPTLQALQRWLASHARSGTSRNEKVALIGLRGAGKSTLGRMVAERFGIPFIEIASEIERLAGMSQSEIFSLYGQGAYRRFERQALEEATNQNGPAIIAAGGGLPTELPTFEYLLSRCVVIWLKARPEDHMARVQAQGDLRPMAGNAEAMQDLKRILEQRATLYGNADASLDTSGLTPDEAAKRLADLIATKATGIKAFVQQ